MTVEQVKAKYGDNRRNGYIYCDCCPLHGSENCIPEANVNVACTGYEDTWNAIADYCTKLEGKCVNEIEADEPDMVNHPPHYNRDGGMECIDEMILIWGKTAVKHYCLCNAWKYRYRAADKNGEEDLKKSDWYMKKYKELTQEEKK